MKLAIAWMAGTLMLGAASAASAADFCRFFSDEHQQGAEATYHLPSVAESSGSSWYAASGIRRSANSLASDGPVYSNAESVRVVARDSAVQLYTFAGEHFDGEVEVLRCDRGETCAWTFGWMKNKARSFICQREHEVGQMLLPTSPIANRMTRELDAQLEASSKIEDAATRWGRMRWTTALKRCEDFSMCWPDDAVLPYHDEIQFSFKSELDPDWQVREYNVWIDFWLRPRVKGTGNPFLISESAWRFSVEDGPAQGKIVDKLHQQIDKVFPALGETITQGIWDSVLAAVGGNQALADLVMKNNERIVLTYTCDGPRMSEIFVEHLGASLDAEQRRDPCGRRVDSSLLSPHIQLVKNVQ